MRTLEKALVLLTATAIATAALAHSLAALAPLLNVSATIGDQGAIELPALRTFKVVVDRAGSVLTVRWALNGGEFHAVEAR